MNLHDKSIEDCLKIIQCTKYDKDTVLTAYYNKSIGERNNGNATENIEDLSKAISIADKDSKIRAELISERAYKYYMSGLNKLSRDDYYTVINSPEAPTLNKRFAHEVLALVLFDLGDYKSSLSIAESELEFDNLPKLSLFKSYNNIGRAKLALHDKKGAKEAFEKASEYAESQENIDLIKGNIELTKGFLEKLF